MQRRRHKPPIGVVGRKIVKGANTLSSQTIFWPYFFINILSESHKSILTDVGDSDKMGYPRYLIQASFLTLRSTKSVVSDQGAKPGSAISVPLIQRGGRDERLRSQCNN